MMTYKNALQYMQKTAVDANFTKFVYDQASGALLKKPNILLRILAALGRGTVGAGKAIGHSAAAAGRGIGHGAVAAKDFVVAHPKTAIGTGAGLLLGGGAATAYALSGDDEPQAVAPVVVDTVAPVAPAAKPSFRDTLAANKGAIGGGVVGAGVGGGLGYGLTAGKDKSVRLLATLLAGGAGAAGGAAAGHYLVDKNC